MAERSTFQLRAKIGQNSSLGVKMLGTCIICCLLKGEKIWKIPKEMAKLAQNRAILSYFKGLKDEKTLG